MDMSESEQQPPSISVSDYLSASSPSALCCFHNHRALLHRDSSHFEIEESPKRPRQLGHRAARFPIHPARVIMALHPPQDDDHVGR